MVVDSEREKTFPVASNFAFLFRLYKQAATLAAISYKFPKERKTQV